MATTGKQFNNWFVAIFEKVYFCWGSESGVDEVKALSVSILNNDCSLDHIIGLSYNARNTFVVKT